MTEMKGNNANAGIESLIERIGTIKERLTRSNPNEGYIRATIGELNGLIDGTADEGDVIPLEMFRKTWLKDRNDEWTQVLEKAKSLLKTNSAPEAWELLVSLGSTIPDNNELRRICS